MPPTLGSARRRRPGQEVAVDDEPVPDPPVDELLEEDDVPDPLDPESVELLVEEPEALDVELLEPEEVPRESVR